ncbi:hypothetical protein AVEN_57884-1 [Araneus ventricosus]|uniref:Uncharacterized protein n=1 Tax=Araneus ventricosus TaxID=182803 RepID=A0A4Y2V9U5_ARAVE|nr:hypothetical protein AVEN_57884-1 [Araneus ventricosus]
MTDFKNALGWDGLPHKPVLLYEKMLESIIRLAAHCSQYSSVSVTHFFPRFSLVTTGNTDNCQADQDKAILCLTLPALHWWIRHTHTNKTSGTLSQVS